MSSALLIVVGVTVVAIGTSLPELAVGVDAARQGSAGLAVGSIVGTNLVDLLLILGLSALPSPIALDSRTVRLDLPLMAAAARHPDVTDRGVVSVQDGDAGKV